MSESYLCNCLFCLKNNPTGKLLPKSTYYRHQRRDQSLLEKELSNNEELSDNEEEKERNTNISLRSTKVSKHCNLLDNINEIDYQMYQMNEASESEIIEIKSSESEEISEKEEE